MKTEHSIENITFPHNARGIDFEEFAFEFRPDGKVNFFSKCGGEHYTLHPGGKSGLIDIHRTKEGTKIHETIFAMKRDDLPKLLKEVEPLMRKTLEGLYRPLRPGWLNHRNIHIIPWSIPMNDAELGAVTKKNPRRRLVIEKKKVLNNIIVALELLKDIYDIYDIPDGMFQLIAMRRPVPKMIGVALKITSAEGKVHLFWMKLKDQRAVMRLTNYTLMNIATKYAIPKEEYGKYGLRV